eukprot:gene38805-52417_t
MRTLIDVPDDDIKWLDRVAAERGKSRASMVREAISAFRAEAGKDWIARGSRRRPIGVSDPFFDTNILIDWLFDRAPAIAELNRYRRHRISRIVWTELLAGEAAETREEVRALLQPFEVVELDERTARLAADLRYRLRMKLLDAMIFATAQVNGAILVTRNTRDFPATMPGIREEVTDRLLDGLKRLEYRGYDSAGIATVHDGEIDRRRASGKLINLVKVIADSPLPGMVGIAHTRWATHGGPTTNNAHPHATGEVALVHNGIIENFKPLRDELIARGRTFTSETDTEVVAHLVSEKVEAGMSPAEAVAEVLPRLHGAFALAILFRQHPELLIGARLGSPLSNSGCWRNRIA